MLSSAAARGGEALVELENQGTASHDASTRRLPITPGCTAQPAWGFRDPTGRVFYWFFGVYGPKHPDQLNQGLSYWAATWLSSESGIERSHVRSMTYREARALHSRLSFEHFSSQVEMRARLPDLLNVGSAGPSE
jgi:hypothetical protein